MTAPGTPHPDSPDGHRKRLRERFLKSGLVGFQDYEIVELLLTLGSPRRDCKQMAKEAIKRFKALRGVLSASPEELQEIRGIGPHNAFGIKLIKEVGARYLQDKIIDKPVFRCSKEIFDYLYYSMRDLEKEVFRVLYLNSQNRIIDTRDLFEGTLTGTSVSPRDVIEDALKHKAVSLVFVHNHPSGNPEPSQSDKQITRDLVYAAAVVQIKVLDHIIIGDNRYISLAAEGLIEQYELDFLGLKMKGVSEARRRIYRAKLFGGLSDSSS